MEGRTSDQLEEYDNMGDTGNFPDYRSKTDQKVYAARVKSCHREEKPEEWAVLHNAYQRAIQYAKRQEKESDMNGSRTVPSPVKPVAREGIRERDAALEKEYGQSETDETEAQWQEYFARIRAGQERSRKMLTEELPERLRGLTLQGEGTQKKRWEEFLQSELAITLYKEPEFWRQIGEHVRAQEWSEEACRYIGKRVEDIKYEFNSRDYTELWRVLDELERICLEEALKDPLRRTKITLRGFGLTILVFVLIGVFVRII